MAKLKSVADCIRQGDGRYNFGHSLYLVVRGGSALWEKQYREGSKLKTQSYGSATGAAPISPMKARTLEWADCLQRRERRQVASNSKYHAAPNGYSNGHSNGHSAPMIAPFSAVRDKYFANMQGGAKPKWTAEQFDTIKRMMEKHAAKLDDRPVGRITLDEVADMLRPIWKGPGSHTGNRVRGLTEKILRAAGIRNDDNPALWENLETRLSDSIVQSIKRASLPFADVPAFVKDLAANTSIQAKALRFMILTATRQDEVLEATWGELDLVGKVWTIPAERMKMTDPHVVPLSDEALAVLKELPAGTGAALVFPSKLGTRMAQQTTRELAKELRPAITITVHGFRSSLTTWAQEQDDGKAYAEPVILAAISHYDGDANKKAYLRSKLFAPRQKLMADWGKFAAGN